MTQKRCVVDLTTQLIENLNARSKTTIKVDELFNKNWNHLGINKEEKKTLCRELARYIKTGKATSKRRASCLNRIKQIRSITDRNRFSRLYYPRSNETFFCFVKTVVMRTPTSSSRQKVIRKLNNIVIARLTTNRWPNILSDIWRFDTSTDWKMLGKEFETWLADLLPDTILITIGMHITNLGYLEDGPPCFT